MEEDVCSRVDSPELFEDEGEEDLEYREVLTLEGEPWMPQPCPPGVRPPDVSAGPPTTQRRNASHDPATSSEKTFQPRPQEAPSPALEVEAVSGPRPGGSAPSASPPLSRIGINAHKAGMEGLDRAKVNQIILEASKGSKFYENEVKREKQVTKRVNWMLEKRKKISAGMIASAHKAVDKEIDALEASRELGRIVVHVDMDAFYAAVEMRDDPRLKDIPMAVGSNYMLSTSNYAARKYGVRAAMPGFIAKKLCPDLVIVRLNFSKYREVSEQVREVLQKYDPQFCPVGLDESYLDLTEFVKNRMSCEEKVSATAMSWKRVRDEVSVSETESMKTATQECSYQCNHGDVHVEQTEVADSLDVAGVPSGGRSTGNNMCERTHRELPSNTGRSSTDLPPHLSQSTSEASTLNTDPGGWQPLANDPPSHAEAVPHAKDSIQDSGDLTDSTSTPNEWGLPPSYWECAQEVVKEMRTQIHTRTGLTASAGIAPNMMLAKVASDMNKPNGQYFVVPTREGVLEFVRKLPIRKISGIGRVTEKMLNALGVTTCQDLHDQRALLHLLFSPVSSQYFLRICMGIGSAQVQRDHERKSISTERTFAEVSDPEELQQKCWDLCQALAEDMRKESIKGRTVTLKLKTVFFKVKSRAVSLPKPLSTAEELYQAAAPILRGEIAACSPEPLRLRLMGVRASSLESAQEHRAHGERLDNYFPHGTSALDSGAVPGSAPGPRGGSCSEDTEMTDSKLLGVDGGHSVVCPVCCQAVPGDNTAFNMHIDECLNQVAIQEATGQPGAVFSPTPTPPTASRVGTPTPPTASRAGTPGSGGRTGAKQGGVVPQGSVTRKRKTSRQSPAASKRRTLEHFWN